LTRAVQVLREAREAFPWAHSGLHPNGESDAHAARRGEARRAARPETPRL